MFYEDSNYYRANYYPGFPQSSMMQGNVTQPSGFPMNTPSGPTYAPPMGTGQQTEQTQAGTMQESFIENILRFNKGKIGTFYFTYQGNNKWNAMVYQGRVETAGRDHIIISDPASGKRYLLLMSNLDWVEFGEEIKYPPVQESTPVVQATLTTSD
ncbi:spore coat protein GerQ [Metabacillus fastidiosus]|uniref:spore coat protein GerQ n=1 Tax=Metabacillus fastidiosus TaxID=1458 RepID=UPI002DBAC07C|nr:spore coat protein GerQ [Metabacillus fastidiosus]MEC2077349.1 spore coat protein GerQ [Metabacillus fastidiosus]